METASLSKFRTHLELEENVFGHKAPGAGYRNTQQETGPNYFRPCTEARYVVPCILNTENTFVEKQCDFVLVALRLFFCRCFVFFCFGLWCIFGLVSILGFRHETTMWSTSS